MAESPATAIEAHRRHVREAILDATAALVTDDGLPAVTLPRIAEKAGMGLARLRTYFADLDAVLRAWHDRQLGNHLSYLDGIRDQPGDPVGRLDAVLRAYAVIAHQTHEHHASALGASLHRGDAIAHARRHVHHLVHRLVLEGIATGELRDDIPPHDLTERCLHAVSAAGGEESVAVIRHLVTATLAEIRR
jgi:AcrR family transcriptional regulator